MTLPHFRSNQNLNHFFKEFKLPLTTVNSVFDNTFENLSNGQKCFYFSPIVFNWGKQSTFEDQKSASWRSIWNCSSGLQISPCAFQNMLSSQKHSQCHIIQNSHFSPSFLFTAHFSFLCSTTFLGIIFQ